MRDSRTLRLPALALVAALAAIALSACGGSGTTTTTHKAASAVPAGSAGSKLAGGFDRSKFTACLKAHGVTLPARPAGAGGGAGAGGPAGGRGFFNGGGYGGGYGGTTRARHFPGGQFSNPKFRTALQACGGGAFGGGFRAGVVRRAGFSHAAVDKFVTCVRQHGYNLPAPNFSGKGGIFPSKIRTNAAFEKASRACSADLVAPAAAPATP
jgi:hypothetical protein